MSLLDSLQIAMRSLVDADSLPGTVSAARRDTFAVHEGHLVAIAVYAFPLHFGEVLRRMVRASLDGWLPPSCWEQILRRWTARGPGIAAADAMHLMSWIGAEMLGQPGEASADDEAIVADEAVADEEDDEGMDEDDDDLADIDP